MAHQALYRKYRPQLFAQIVGQNKVVDSLRTAVKQQKLSHCYLFFGSHGTGKTSTAKIFATAVNCLNVQNGEPCLRCEMCLLMANNSCLDFFEIDGASYNGVNEVREIKKQVATLPVHGQKKVYLIDEAHMLTNAAFNALLKTIEEPPAYIIFLFATTNRLKMPLTVLSRCQQYQFKAVSTGLINEQLKRIVQAEKITINREACHLIANLAHGSMRDALSLTDRCLLLAQHQTVATSDIEALCDVLPRAKLDVWWELLFAQETTALLNTVNSYENKVNFFWLLDTLLADAKQMFEYFLTKEQTYLTTVSSALAQQASKQVPQAKWAKMLALILKTYQASRTTRNLFLQFYLLTMHLQTLLAPKSVDQTARIGQKPNQRTRNGTLGSANNVSSAGISNKKSAGEKIALTAKKVGLTKQLVTFNNTTGFASLTSGMSAEGIYKEMRAVMPATKTFHVKEHFVFNLLVNFEQKTRCAYEQKYATFLHLTNVAAATQLWFLLKGKITAASANGFLFCCEDEAVVAYANEQLSKKATQAVIAQVWKNIYIVCISKADISKWKRAYQQLANEQRNAHQLYQLTCYDYFNDEPHAHFFAKAPLFTDYNVQ